MMAGLAKRLDEQLERMRLGKGRHEAQLRLRDGSYLHFRHDRHTRWVQAGGGGENGLASLLVVEIECFELKNGRLKVQFGDASTLEVWLGVFGRLHRRPG
ncbi:hypothetical protein [Oceanithermus sp.]